MSELSILRLPAVQARTGLARSTIYLKVEQGQFPKPIKLGARAVGWTSDSIDRWIDGRVRASQGEVA